MTRRNRLIIAGIVVLGLAPGLWWRMPHPRLHHDAPVTVVELEGLPQRAGELKLVGAWELDSRNEHFGGFSALVMLDNRTLLSASDKARFMRISLPLSNRIRAEDLGFFRPGGAQDKHLSDLESLGRDPRTGTLWAAYENLNTIERIEPAGARHTKPIAGIADWPTRSGAEAIERLPDGRFLVIGESREGGGSPALLYPGDPLDSGQPLAFRFQAPDGYSPTGAAALPDGRVLILVRTWDFAIPIRFRAAIVLADPAEIAPGKGWRGRIIGRLESPIPSDNFEGITTEAGADGTTTIWVISDDNFMSSQRTLLLELRWKPKQKARENPRTPR